ncbi:MAG TPA: hypothetical protein VFB39_12190, partial [Solirubrobacteraceae bacterium]|nr:hypothetical protein [Solirubrobacteraceae bacterium]
MANGLLTVPELAASDKGGWIVAVASPQSFRGGPFLGQRHAWVQSIESRKIDMLRTNPAVCMEVDEYDPGNWCSVVIWRECTPRAHLLRGRFGGRQRRQERASADALRGAASHTSSSTAGLQRCPRLALRWLEEETARRGGERRAALLRGRCVSSAGLMGFAPRRAW